MFNVAPQGFLPTATAQAKKVGLVKTDFDTLWAGRFGFWQPQGENAVFHLGFGLIGIEYSLPFLLAQRQGFCFTTSSLLLQSRKLPVISIPSTIKTRLPKN